MVATMRNATIAVGVAATDDVVVVVGAAAAVAIWVQRY